MLLDAVRFLIFASVSIVKPAKSPFSPLGPGVLTVTTLVVPCVTVTGGVVVVVLILV